MAKGKRIKPSGEKKSAPSATESAPANTPKPVEPSAPIGTPSQTEGPFFRRVDWMAALLATLISLGVYLYTLAPDVTLEDSGELAVGSMYAGVPHPPGYPMWTIYSWFFTKILPFSNIAWRVAVSSAVAAALSCGLLALMVSRGTQLILSGLETFKSLTKKTERGLSLCSGLSAGLIFGFNGFIWSQAVIVEVYTLGILTFALTLALLMRWFYRPQQRLYLYLAYFVFGLCFVNHQTLILAAIGMELMILLADPKLGRDFLTGNCVLYLIGLVLSLKGAEHGSAGNPGLFILFNLVGAGFMALLIGLTIRFPSNLMRALVATAFLAIGLIFGLVWNAALGKSQFTQANTMVKLWTFINLATLCGLIAYSWINRDKDSGEEGLLSNWMPLLNTRAAWIIAALLYFYMPIASMTNPPMNWAYPRTTQGFKHAITRGQYDRITPSNPTRMFLDASHTPITAATPNARTQFDGGQLGIYLDEASEEFSLSYVALAFVPLAFLYRMRLKEFRWILGLTGIYVTFTLILIYLINPTADELNRHLNKVFFAATHIFIAGAIGLGLALIGATLASSKRAGLTGIVAFLGGLVLLEGISTYRIIESTVFAMERAAAYIGWGLLGTLLVAGIIRRLRPSIALRTCTLIALATVCLLPLRPALNNWAENEQRNHLFGYWYGHDMFTPPFDIYPEMDQDAILFGGTDPGRFCPTYFIFCESFIDRKHKRDPDFDRRDVYIITQNALADGTYLQYIRAHYNPSTQNDPHFFQELVAKINNSSKRMHLNVLLFLGLLAGLAMALYAFNRYETHANRRHILGIGAWGGVLLLGCFLGFSGPLAKAATSADKFFTELGDKVDAQRRAKGIYPEKEIHTPSAEDNQIAFAGYYAAARERLMNGTLQSGEDVRLILNFQCPNCLSTFPMEVDRNTARLLNQIEKTGSYPCPRDKTPMPIPEPQVSVAGTTAVMDINARLAKTIFEMNREHSFYLEESFPLAWMYPYLSPSGIIFKLEAKREFEIATITPPKFAQLNGIREGDKLTPVNLETDTQLITINPGDFRVGPISQDGIIQSIQVEKPGEFEIKPANSCYVKAAGTNEFSAILDLTFDSIPETPLKRITSAKVKPTFGAGGRNYKVGQVLTLQSTTGYKAIQYQGSGAGTLHPGPLRVKAVGPIGEITEVEIIDEGGRLAIKPPSQITFKTGSGKTVRLNVNFRRIPKYTDELPPESLTKDRRFWRAYSERLIGDWIEEDTPVEDICEWIERTYQRRDLSNFQGSPEFIRDNDAQKGFSKLRAAIAGLYTWRSLNTKDPVLRQRYQREAHFAYRQAIAFGPINPETVFKFINLLSTMNQHDDAIRLAQTYRKLDPANPSSLIFVRQVLQNREQQLIAAGDFKGAMAIIEQLNQIDPKNDHLIRRDHYQRQLDNENYLINAFTKNPANPTNFVQAIYIHGRRARTNEILTAIDTFSPLAGEDPKNLTLIKNAYGLIQRWGDKAVIDEKLTTLTPDDYAPWFDLAQTRLQLQQTNRATQALKEALTRFEKGTESSSALNIIDAIRTNAIFAPLREHPEIKPFLEETEEN